MVRRYADSGIDAAAIDRIVDAAVRAPSAGFSQGQRFIVVTEESLRAALAEAAGEGEYVSRGFSPWISVAPVLIVVCIDKQAYVDRYAERDKAGTGGWDVPYWWVDAGASLMAILYAAVDEGLAAGFLGAHAFEGLHPVLDIPEDIEVVGVVTLGHAAPDQSSARVKRGRLPRDEVVRRERW